MRRLSKSKGFVLALLISVAAGSQSATPRFDDYPAGPLYKGVPAALKLDKPGTRMYAEEIRNGVDTAYNDKNLVQKGPNFAGEYVVVKWGCGSPCLRMAIVNVRTGEIYYPPLTFEGSGPQNFDLPALTPKGSVSQNPEVRFRPDSNLMIVKATPSQRRIARSYTYYFLWKQGGWTLLRKDPLVAP